MAPSPKPSEVIPTGMAMGSNALAASCRSTMDRLLPPLARPSSGFIGLGVARAAGRGALEDRKCV